VHEAVEHRWALGGVAPQVLLLLHPQSQAVHQPAVAQKVHLDNLHISRTVWPCPVIVNIVVAAGAWDLVANAMSESFFAVRKKSACPPLPCGGRLTPF